MSDAIRGGVVAFLLILVISDLYFSWESRCQSLAYQSATTAIIESMKMKIEESVQEKNRLYKKINHLEYLNRKFAKAEKMKGYK